MTPQQYAAKIAARKEKKLQHTRHQQLALETAEKLDDMESIDIYMAIFKKHQAKLERLLKCVEWVQNHVPPFGNKGRVFVKSYKKFLK